VIDGETLDHGTATLGAQAAGELGIGEHALDSGGDGIGLVIDQQSVFTVADGFGKTADTARDDGNSRGHCEQGSGAEAFAVSDVDENGSAAEIFFQIGGERQVHAGDASGLHGKRGAFPGIAGVGWCEHAGSDRSRFDETRVGLDHLAFGLDGVDELDAWERRLHDCNVTFTPAAPANTIDGAYVLVLRDPDNIQLELFAER